MLFCCTSAQLSSLWNQCTTNNQISRKLQQQKIKMKMAKNSNYRGVFWRNISNSSKICFLWPKTCTFNLVQYYEYFHTVFEIQSRHIHTDVWMVRQTFSWNRSFGSVTPEAFKYEVFKHRKTQKKIFTILYFLERR